MPIAGVSQLIIQLSPVSATTTVVESDEYTNQLNQVGAQSTLTYTTTNASTAFTVAANGSITTTGTLSIGAYSASGTVMDQSGNAGVWAFTLTVIGNTSPQTTVQPSVAPAPTGIEMLVPFQIDPATGGVAFLSNYNDIIAQHVLTVIMTAQNERLMNPSYGYGLDNMIFAPTAELTQATTSADITAAINNWESAVKVLGVDIVVSPANASTVIVTVNYSVVPYSDVNQVKLSVGGGVVQVISI